MGSDTKSLKCSCGTELDFNAMPALWIPESRVHGLSQMLVIMTRSFCCGKVSHTEPVAAVSSCLRPVKENARLMCNLMNQYLLAGRPQPQWLTELWAQWEESFQRPNYAKKPVEISQSQTVRISGQASLNE